MDKSKETQSMSATTPEARENQLIALATNLAEKQLREGTASSQVITHYLKLGSTKERLEKELMMKQKDFVEAKTESIKTAKESEENLARMYRDVMEAMQLYSGNG